MSGKVHDLKKTDHEFPVNQDMIRKVLTVIKDQLILNADQCNRAVRNRKLDKIKVLNVAVTVAKDKYNVFECKVDFGYTEKVTESFTIGQQQIPGM